VEIMYFSDTIFKHVNEKQTTHISNE
jgi:hypothetical protein